MLKLLVLAAFAADAPLLMPPAPPAHSQRSMETAADVSKDLHETLAFLESGQSYYKAYAKGTHSSEENKAFVKFLQDYERELETAKKEFALLQTWFKSSSELKRD